MAFISQTEIRLAALAAAARVCQGTREHSHPGDILWYARQFEKYIFEPSIVTGDGVTGDK